MRIKICGVTRTGDARRAGRLGAWAIGMIFVPDTPRFLTADRAKKVRAAIPKGVKAVGVFRNPSREEILRAVRELNLDMVQIYGKAPSGLRVPAISVVEIGRRRPRIPRFGPTDFVLVEPERTLADRRAGRGPSEKSRWAARALVAAWQKRGLRVLLGGGLNAQNVAEAVTASPWAVDVSAGVEGRAGCKDLKLLRRFFQEANRG